MKDDGKARRPKISSRHKAMAAIIGAIVQQQRKTQTTQTQAEFAKRLGLAQSTVSRVERGLLIPDFIQMEKIGGILYGGITGFIQKIQSVEWKVLRLAVIHANAQEAGKGEALYTVADAVDVLGKRQLGLLAKIHLDAGGRRI